MKHPASREWSDEKFLDEPGVSPLLDPNPGKDVISPASKVRKIVAVRSYRPAAAGLALIACQLIALWLLGTILLLNILLVGVGWMLYPAQVPTASELMNAAGIVLAILIPFCIWARAVLMMPIDIDIDEEERMVWFRAFFRSRGVPASAILSIKRSGWRRDSSRFYGVILHKGGKVTLPAHFRDFGDFLVRLKALNPSVEIRGFRDF